MNDYSVSEDSPIEDKGAKPVWVDVEMDIDSPNRDTREDDLDKLFKSQGREGMRLSTYIWVGQASKVLTGEHFDQGATYSRLLGSSHGITWCVPASIRWPAQCHWNLYPQHRAPAWVAVLRE